MITALFLSLAMSSVPPRVGLMTGSRVGVSEPQVQAVEQRLGDALRRSAFEVLVLPAACRGERACLLETSATNELDALVSLGLARGPTHVIIDVEVLSVRAGAVPGQRTWKWKNEAPLDSLGELMETFALELAGQLRPPIAADAPLEAKLVPAPPVAAPVEVTAPSNAPKIICVVGAGGALVAAAVLTGVGLGQQSHLPPLGSSLPALPREEAAGYVRGANDAYTGAAIAGGVAGALAVTAVVLWVTSR